MSDFYLLLEEQLPKLMRYVTALTRDPDEAESLVEDTVREALANQNECPRDGQIRLWLLTILHDLRDNPFRRASFGAASPPRGPEAELTFSDLDRAPVYRQTLIDHARQVLEPGVDVRVHGLRPGTYGERYAPIHAIRYRYLEALTANG